MTTIGDITSSTTMATSSTSSSSLSSLSEDFDAFLTLLTEQLQHQSPLDPMDASEFTSQLVQYASVEQQIQTNDTLESLSTQVSSLGTSVALSFIGKTVTVGGDTTPLTEDGAEWVYDLDSEAADVVLTIADEDGNTVATYDGTGDEGLNTFVWDGTTDDGTVAPEGNYTLSVDAVDEDNEQISYGISIVADVTGVDISDGDVTLELSTMRVLMDNVTNVVT